MRMHLQKILPLFAGLALVACEIPGDGFSELKGTIQIPGTLLPLVVQPADMDPAAPDPDCDIEGNGWGSDPSLGDITPTLYVGLYTRPIKPLDRALYSSADDDNWRQGCGDIDADEDPITPPVHNEASCPIGGTTATYVQTIAGTSGGAVFEFNALQLPTGDAFLIAWLDNKCADNNGPTANLVWDIGGPPGPRDAEGAKEDGDDNDITIVEAIPVSIGEGGNRLDDTLVLNSALNLADSLPPTGL